MSAILVMQRVRLSLQHCFRFVCFGHHHYHEQKKDLEKELQSCSDRGESRQAQCVVVSHFSFHSAVSLRSSVITGNQDKCRAVALVKHFSDTNGGNGRMKDSLK